MPQELIKKYNERHHSNINAIDMMGAVSSILVAYKDAEKRDEMLKQYLMESYSVIAGKYQHDKMSKQIRGESTAEYKAKPQELLGEYIGIFTVVVNTVSEQRLEDAKQAAIDAKAATEKALQAAEAARIAYNDSLKTNLSASRGLKAEFDKLNEKYQTAKKNEKDVFTFEKYTPTMRYFTLGSHDVQNMMNSQMAGYTYKDFRRHQLKTHGVLDPMFQNDLPSLQRNVDLGNLKREEQERIMQTWVTKQLMQEELDSRTWWSKNILNRKEAKAMRDYIANANTVLENANHGDQEYFEDVLNAMLLKGYEKIDNTLENNMNEFAAKFQVNDSALRALAEKKEQEAQEQRDREEQERLAREERKNAKKQAANDLREKQNQEEAKKNELKQAFNDKKAVFQSAIDEINAKNKANTDALEGQTLFQQLQDPKFVPSFDNKTFWNQFKALNDLGSYVKSKDMPQSTVDIIYKNRDKLKLMNEFMKMTDPQKLEKNSNYTADDYIKKANEIYKGCQDIQKEQEKIAQNADYVKFSGSTELKALRSLTDEEKAQRKNKPEKVNIDINQVNGEQPDEVSPVHEAPAIGDNNELIK